MSQDWWRQTLSAHLIRTGKAALSDIAVEMRRLVQPVPAFEQAEGSELVVACENASGQTADAVNFATEAPFLKSLGLETIVMGPGSMDVVHQPNEYMPLDQI